MKKGSYVVRIYRNFNGKALIYASLTRSVCLSVRGIMVSSCRELHGYYRDGEMWKPPNLAPRPVQVQ